mmetsp:Transcript_65054/g.76999  ORF Transcript_65054/g.76999 Transcript_65054/m.76999 type:complete len:170 (+) Transcript_65054:188-697(+)
MIQIVMKIKIKHKNWILAVLMTQNQRQTIVARLTKMIMQTKKTARSIFSNSPKATMGYMGNIRWPLCIPRRSSCPQPNAGTVNSTQRSSFLDKILQQRRHTDSNISSPQWVEEHIGEIQGKLRKANEYSQFQSKQVELLEGFGAVEEDEDEDESVFEDWNRSDTGTVYR